MRISIDYEKPNTLD